MQNRGALWIFTILLALACVYQLSFSFFTSGLERKAAEEAGYKADSVLALPGNQGLDREALKLDFENNILRSKADEQVYPVLGYSYSECKEKEINLGLDLKGGMAVTLEVSIPELVVNLSGNSSDPAFTKAIASARERQKSSNADFITLFGEEYAKIPERGPLSAIFYTPDRKDMFEREGNDADYLKALRKEAEAALNNTERILRTRIDKFGVAQPSIQKQQFSGRIQIELPGVKDKDRVRKVLQSTANLEFWETYDNTEIGPLLDQANTPLSAILHPELAEASTDTAEMTAALDTLAVQDTVAVQDTTLAAAADSAAALDSLADTDTTATDQDLSEEEARKKAPLSMRLRPLFDPQRGWMRGAIVGQADLKDTAEVNRLLAMDVVRKALPMDVRLAWAAKAETAELVNGSTAQLLNLFALKLPRDGKPKLDGSSIVNASQDFDMKGAVEVTMQMDAEGAQTWKVMTGDNVGKSIAIVLDELVYSAPTVMSEIAGGRSSISMGSGNMNSQIQEADDLANILKAGALPAPARIIDETVVGPSLGEQNIDRGMMSFAVALIGVLLVMGLYYAGAGWIADIALLANVFFLLGTMASMQASLTLAGIAGIVLTIGMAVDANVLINERVRDELKAGRMLKSAIESAYSNQGALSAIIDSNVTTFITAVILYLFGSGPIRGFATTLGLGILTSLFTAIFITRLVMIWRMERNKPISFSRSWNINLFDGANVDFMGKRKLFYGISFVIIGIGIASMVTRGFNWGVDFTGGRTYVVEFQQPVDLDQVRETLEPMVTDEAGRQYTLSVKTYGGAQRLKITTNYMIEESGLAMDSVVQGRVAEGLTKVGAFSFAEETRKVDPTISDDIKTKALTSVAIALVFMFVYIAIRFSNWQYGLGALLSLLHDVLVVLGLYSLLWGVVGFSMEIDEAFIAVILTVVGYSINDTVVVFDRIREYTRDHKRDPVVPLFNRAINSTLSRTLNTGVCTLLVLVIIFFFGGVSIKGFVFGLFVGTLVGTYSSIFVASAAAVDLLLRGAKAKA
jgi:SecD/SecF fusion protein